MCSSYKIPQNKKCKPISKSQLSNLPESSEHPPCLPVTLPSLSSLHQTKAGLSIFLPSIFDSPASLLSLLPSPPSLTHPVGLLDASIVRYVLSLCHPPVNELAHLFHHVARILVNDALRSFSVCE